MRQYFSLMSVLLLSTAVIFSAGSVHADDDDDDDDAVEVAVTAAAAPPAAAQQVTRASKDVPELILGSASDSFTVNQTDFELIAGQGYRWKITSAAGLEYKFVTDMFRNVWMNQIVVNDLEIHMNGAPAWLEFDSEGTMQVQFTTIRPGNYTWSVPDLADKGLKGTITIK